MSDAVIETDLGNDGLVRDTALGQLLTERSQCLEGRCRNTHQHRIINLTSRGNRQALGVGTRLTLLAVFADMRTPDILRAGSTGFGLRLSGIHPRSDTVVGVAQRLGIGAFGVTRRVVDLGQLVASRTCLEDDDFQGASWFVVGIGDQSFLVATLQGEHLAFDGHRGVTAATRYQQVVGQAEGFLQECREAGGLERDNLRFAHYILQNGLFDVSRLRICLLD